MKNMTINETIIALSLIKGIGPRKIEQTIEVFKNKDVLSNHQILDYINCQFRLNVKIDEIDNHFDYAKKSINKMLDKEIYPLNLWENNFPKKLRNIKKKPILIFYKGNLSLLDEKVVAIIGTRKSSNDGNDIAYSLAKRLTQDNYVILSGLANGIDSYAHQGSLEIKEKAIVVLPSPIDNIYPKEGIKIADKIIKADGLILSEYWSGSTLQKYNFIDRDRIQSALSDYLVVIETGINGGTMHTVKFALDNNTPVFVYINKAKKINYVGNEYLVNNRQGSMFIDYSELIKLIKTDDFNLFNC